MTTLNEINEDLFIRSAIDHAYGTSFAASSNMSTRLPSGILIAVQDAIRSGAMPVADGVTIGQMARGLLAHRIAHLNKLASTQDEEPAHA